jgi:hypothetical protein
MRPSDKPQTQGHLAGQQQQRPDDLPASVRWLPPPVRFDKQGWGHANKEMDFVPQKVAEEDPKGGSSVTVPADTSTLSPKVEKKSELNKVNPASVVKVQPRHPSQVKKNE